MPEKDNTAEKIVEAAEKVHKDTSDLMSEAKVRHEWAQTEYATPQEKRQAAVEMADALPNARPEGSHAQLHATDEPTVIVADEGRVKELKERQDEAVKALEGAEPANTKAGARREEQSAKARQAEREAAAKQSDRK